MAKDETPEEVAAIDAVFADLPAAPIAPPAIPDVPVAPPRRAETGPHKSPLTDYLRELQQEFTEQEDEGKL